MIRSSSSLALSLSFVLLATTASAQELALKRVMLSTGGVGYFEYEAKVTGDAQLDLPVRLDQVNDVLKSVVVYDDKGGVGEISLPGKEPLREAFREMPFGQDALESPVALLNALRGAEVRVKGGREVAGRVLSIVPYTTELPNNGGTITRHRVSLMTSSGMRQFVLEETDTLEFTDAALQAQVNGALAALARHNEQERRTLNVRVTGQGERTVHVAYVVEAPLWKATYRLTVDGMGKDAKGDLQGWAVLENMSGEDWKNVDLTVVSGNPVTFRQQLYNAYYVDRPEVPVEVLGRVLPRVDEGAAPLSEPAFIQENEAAPALKTSRSALGKAAPVAPQMMMDMAGQATGSGFAGGIVPTPAPARVFAAESTEAATQVAFHMPHPVNVSNGDSVLLPIVSRDIPAEQLALYQIDTHLQNPLAAVRLSNDTKTGLPPGVLTLYERAPDTGAVTYVGDARMNALPAGEERLVSFAVDQKVRVLMEMRDEETITEGKIADGVLEVRMTRRNQTLYTVTGAANEPRTVVLERPRIEGWDIVEPDPKSVQVTDRVYRIRQDVPAGETVTVSVVLEHPEYQQVQLVDLYSSQLEYYASAPRLSEKTRQVLARLAELSAAVENQQQQLNQIQSDTYQIVEGQKRLRENLGSVPKDSDLHARYLDKLSAEEDRIDTLNDQKQKVEKALEKARQARLEYVRGLKI